MDVFLSPHLDDVVLSIGGLVAQRARQGRAVVLTVCAGEPGGPLGDLAQQLHRSWGDPERPVALRRAEDARALALLGAEQVLLEELDAPYRHPAYASTAALFGPPAGDDGLRERLEGPLGELLLANQAATFYAPLAVGGHVDHQLVHGAGRWLQRQGAAVLFYEELPYALVPGALARRLAEAGAALAPRCVDVTAEFPAKLQAAQRYASQVPALFGGAGPLCELLTAYAVSLSSDGRRCCERLWAPS